MKYDPLMDVLGYHFTNVQLLEHALTHPSYALAQRAKDNQRLEFLGDAVLELCVSHTIYTRHPEMKEGQLTRLRALLVRESSLARAAQRLTLGKYLRLDHGEEISGGREKPSILADAMEATIAAVYLDGGLAAAGALIERALDGYKLPPQEERDAKSTLQETMQSRGEVAPHYEIISEEGPPHERVFTARALTVEGKTLGEGSGVSKKRAEQEAAKAALRNL